MNRRGFTIVELLVVFVVLGILANLAVPALGAVRLRADAARIIGDFDAIRVAAHDRFVSAGAYPDTGDWGAAPPDLIRGLPANFQFSYKDATYRWHRWSLPGGASERVMLGLDVHSDNTALLAALVAAFHSGVAFGTPNEVTLVID